MVCSSPRTAILLLLAALGLLAPQDALQAGTTGRLEGSVRDAASGEPLPGATLLVLETSQGCVADAEGRFVLQNLRAGLYQVRASLLGYRTVVFKEVTILPDLRTKLEVRLEAAPIEMAGVEVTAVRPVIQTDVTGTAYEKTAAQMETLPITRFQEVVGMQPGATADGHVRGGKSREVIYLVDGLPIQDQISGGLGMELPRSAVSQLSVKTGGFDAEYGQALSGIVNVITRSGDDQPRLQLRLAKDDLFGGTQVSKSNEAELTASGPLVRRKGSFFLANTLLLSGTRWWQDMEYFFRSPTQKELYGMAKTDWNFSSDKRLTGQLLYSLKRSRDYAFSWRYNLVGLPLRRSESLRSALYWTHTLNPRLFYSISLSQSGMRARIGEGAADSVAGTPWEYDFYLRYVVRGDRIWWADLCQNSTTLKTELTSQWRPAHLFKAGMEIKQYAIRSTLIKMEPQLSYFGKPLIDLAMLNYSTRYRYFPRFGALFIQDKYESPATRSVISAGLRCEFFDPRARRPAVELIPAGPDEYREEITGSVPARIAWQISPRIGFAFPFTDKSFFFINWGRYLQFPLFEHLYSGLDNVTFERGVKVLRGNPDLLAEKTSALEISIRHNFYENWVGSVLWFQKETTDQIDSKTFVSANSRIAGDYGFAEYVNNPYATAHGFEFVISRERGKWLTGSLSYTLMEAKGLSETEDQGLNYAQWGFPVAHTPYYLSWDQRHSLKADLDLALPGSVQMNLVWHYHSGRPYTYYPSENGFAAENAEMLFVPNNRRMPGFNQTDLRLSKAIAFGGTASPWLELYFEGHNLFNARNVIWIDASGRTGGELGDPSARETGRRLLAGCRLGFGAGSRQRS
ncbi:MAG TPA: TonB-dependent receptor [bacterium]|nr:TonB-dependent receptor [bacterium]HQI47093.1 TonB-dependent receptor [bacterium]